MNTSIEQVVDETVERYREELSKALQESLNLVKDELKKAEQEGERILERAKEDGNRAYRHHTTQAELESRGMTLRAFEEALDGLIGAAINELGKVDRGRYSKSLKSFLLEAVDAIGSSELEVRPSKKDASLLKKLCKEVEKERGVNLTISKKGIGSDHGFIALSKDGKVTVDYTPESLKERLKPVIRRRVAEEYLKGVI